MKVDMNKLKEPKKSLYSNRIKGIACLAGCLVIIGGGMIYHSIINSNDVSADEMYDESLANPSFTVQHFADVSKIDLSDNGSITVLTNDKTYHAGLDESSGFKMVTEHVSLYDDYETYWNKAASVDSLSFLSDSRDYELKEIWFGDNEQSNNQSDFNVLSVDDLSHVSLTNNTEHPELSDVSGGYYVADDNGDYTICIEDGDVIRFVYAPVGRWESVDINAFDYDVSDGGYYLEDDNFHRKELHNTSNQDNENGMIYVDAIENGIHLSDNYSGEGAKLSFGGDDIGTELANETFGNGLDTINIRNFGQQDKTSDTGVTKGLIEGIDSNGNVKWADGISAPDLFSDSEVTGKTSYMDGKYSFTFKRDGSMRTLSAVESEYGTAAEWLETLDSDLTNSFWIMDGAPSYGSNGHDPVWGGSSRKISYYKTGDREPDVFKTSDDEKDHNSFFGYSYTQDFVLTPGYNGPLDFFGYSDDDMWVFAAPVQWN